MFGLLLRFLWPLRTIEGTALSPSIYAGSIQSSSKDVVTYTGKVLHTTAAHKHDGVLLKVVALAGDVCVDLFLIGKSHTGYLTHSRVRLPGSGGVDTHAHTSLLRARIQRARFAFLDDNLASFAN